MQEKLFMRMEDLHQKEVETVRRFKHTDRLKGLFTYDTGTTILPAVLLTHPDSYYYNLLLSHVDVYKGQWMRNIQKEQKKVYIYLLNKGHKFNF